jgi:hypothetical protein
MINVPKEVLALQERQGWSDSSLLLFALRALEDAGVNFEEYLEACAAEEAEEIEEEEKTEEEEEGEEDEDDDDDDDDE